jgi:hypothetical protein
MSIIRYVTVINKNVLNKYHKNSGKVLLAYIDGVQKLRETFIIRG